MTTDTEVEAGLASSKTPVHVRKASHAVFEVSDIERSIDFWTRIMGFEVSDVNDRGHVFLHCGPDHHTVGLVEVPGATRLPADAGLRVRHVAFEVASLDELFAIRDFFRDEGVEIISEGRHGAGGNTELGILDPDGYHIEIICDMDHPNDEGRYRPSSQFRRASSLEEVAAHPLPTIW